MSPLPAEKARWHSAAATKPYRPRLLHLFVALVLCYGDAGHRQAAANPGGELAGETGQYAVLDRKTIVDLQEFRHVTSIDVRADDGSRGIAKLFNLNPYINAWYLLQLDWPGGGDSAFYHLENPEPAAFTVSLDSVYPEGITVVGRGSQRRCSLWSAATDRPLETARSSGTPFAPLCEGQIYLRNKTDGHRTNIEWVTDLLRDNVWGGEKITTFVRRQFFKDAFLLEAPLLPADAPEEQYAPSVRRESAPAAALVDAKFSQQLIEPRNLGLTIGDRPRDKVIPGRWYQHRDNPGVFFSLLQPRIIAADILRSYQGTVKTLDEVESEALVYSVAFDLDRFEAGFAVGTEHPRVGWSMRALDSIKDPSVPGPDGIGDIEPLVATGIVNPADRKRAAAAFAGGFKRAHAAFKYSELAHKNHGSHYGIIENGVVFSKLHPGLATFLIHKNGTVHLKTWTNTDDQALPRIRHARQNGVPLIEFDAASGTSRPGRLVGQWGAGNWSGSEDGKLRALRSGVCLQERNSKRFLIYSYFSTATPSAMARVFQAYRCTYALHLDMNALEHTYIAVYRGTGPERIVEHLIDEMKVLDKSAEGRTLPRFIGYADNRDFLYLLRREH